MTIPFKQIPADCPDAELSRSENEFRAITARLATAEKALREGHQSAVLLAETIWRMYYQPDAPHWKPAETTPLVVSQIDNMFAGMRDRALKSEAARRDEESWWKEKHDYQARANAAESQLATTQQQLADATAELERVRLALEAIANYDEGSKFGEGICPYGCDTPFIARNALARCGEIRGAARPDAENANDRFERLAAQFYEETGMMAPGKDDHSGSYTREARCAAWDKWLAARPDAPLPSAGKEKPNSP